MIRKQLHSEFKVHFILEKDLIHRGFDFITFKPFLIIFFLHEYMNYANNSTLQLFNMHSFTNTLLASVISISNVYLCSVVRVVYRY